METLLQINTLDVVGGWMLWQYLLAAGVSTLVFAGCSSVLELMKLRFSHEKSRYDQKEASFAGTPQLSLIGRATNIVGVLSLVLIPMGGIAFLLELFSAIDTAGGGGAVEWYQFIGATMVVAAALFIPVKIYYNRGLVGTRHHRRNSVVGEMVLLFAGLVISFDALILVAGMLEWYQIIGVVFLLGGVSGLVFSRDLRRGGASGLGGFIWIGTALLFAGQIVSFTGDAIEGLPFFWQVAISLTVFYFAIGVGWIAGLQSEAGMDYGGDRMNAAAGPAIALTLTPAILLAGVLPLSAFIALIAALDQWVS